MRRSLLALPLLAFASPAVAQDLALARAGRRAMPVAPIVAETAGVRAGAVRVAVPYPVVTSRDTSAIAVRAPVPHRISADETAPIWENAQLIDGFRVFDPKEDGDPSMRTTAKVAYDEKNLYVLVRAYDPHPDSIVALLSRRDVRTASEWIKIMIDAYHDRRSVVELAVNPVGVKRDYAIYNDGDEDESWDGIWEVATKVDREGWVAEFKVPLSQLRFSNKASNTFGLMIWRDIARTQERQSWPPYRRSKSGLTSQFGEVTGIAGVATPRRLEIVPYSVTKDFQQERDLAAGTRFDRVSTQTWGADVKLGLSSNLTLDATINPDFGQVEADPAALNLSAFELYFQERRPFFTEGAGIFNSFAINCDNGACSGLLYSRRIGRSPQLAGTYGDATSPQFTPIRAAAKLTGRLPSGLSIGVLDAVTEDVKAPGGQSIEPGANYFVTRLMQDLNGGSSGVGLMLTATNRTLDANTAPYLRRAAYTAGVDARHRFFGNNYEVSGWLVGSSALGSPAAIALLQANSTHGYNRPDGGLGFDTTRTSLDGYGASASLRKIGGGITRFELGYQRLSPGFEINDAGFLPRVDQQGLYGWFAFQFQTPTALYRRWFLNFNGYRQWNTGGMGTGGGGNINSFMQLSNYWGVFSGVNINNVFDSYDDRQARGGPAIRRSGQGSAWIGFNGDDRKPIVPNIEVDWWQGDEGHTHGVSINPGMTFRATSRMQGSLSAGFSRNASDAQWYGNYGVVGVDTTHYTFARLEQRTASLTARFDVTMTPTLTLQVYAQPFITTGHYTNWKELNDPRNASYDARFKPYAPVGDALGDFNYKQFRSNTVLRWEYRPGSTLFFVWTQGREQYDRDLGVFNARNDVTNLFGTQPANTFLVKASYWFSL
ncbi:MAG: carbohydrate binding family 9 domain-containing protein [Gemmatimonadetes bacterium]|nr:carbohydrate binding family 9 domain-containing protein [Gemmatimonadota bacterium]